MIGLFNAIADRLFPDRGATQNGLKTGKCKGSGATEPFASIRVIRERQKRLFATGAKGRE